MTKNLIELTRSVAPSASVSEVRMSLGQFHAPEIAAETSAIEYSISPKYKAVDDDGEFLCTICFRLRAVTDDEDRAETGLRIHAHFDVAISIDGEHAVDAVDAFIRLNSVFVTWSYLREFVQNCTSRMQLPPLTLPLMTASAIAHHIAQDDDCDEEDTQDTSSRANPTG